MIPKKQTKVILRRVRHYARKLEQKGYAGKRLATKLRQKRQWRQQAQIRLRRNRREVTPAGGTDQRMHALPEPDWSIDRQQIFRALISPLKLGKMLDLGAGPGNFSLTAAQLGWEATAVDARSARTPDPETEKDPDLAELIRSIRWVEADVREFPIHKGEYDLICILGLMHHLEVDDQVQLLKRCSDTLTLLDVRVAPKITDTQGPYEGRYRREKGGTREERDQVLTAAWGNASSFHHTEESLLRLVWDCGYSKVMPMRPPHSLNYTFYLCLPSSLP